MDWTLNVNHTSHDEDVITNTSIASQGESRVIDKQRDGENL